MHNIIILSYLNLELKYGSQMCVCISQHDETPF